MATGQLIATVDCITQEIILDVQGGTATGDFRVMFPDATIQAISGTLPLTVTSIFSGIHVFWNVSLDPSSTVTSVAATSLDVQYTSCEEIYDMSYCLFNLNNAYEKAKCTNDKQAEIEKKKLDRALQLVALMENITECGVDQLYKYKAELNTITNCDNCTTLDDDIWGDYEVYGCTDSNADNYNPAANIDDGTCGDIVFGCTNPIANNYDPLSTTDDGSCTFDIYGCTDATASNYDSTATIDDGSCIACVYGCTDNTAVNYDSLSNCDDGSCIAIIYGCTDSAALNYNGAANIDDGTCNYGTSNCANNTTTATNQTGYVYFNYNSSALYDCNSEVLGTAGDSSTGLQNTGYDSCCIPCVEGCTESIAINYNPLATCNDGSCIAIVYGCTDPTALNYYAGANVDDGSCCLVYGCMDNAANNYNSAACFDDGSCTYCNVYGCTDTLATNYDPLADCDDGSCVPFVSNCNGTTAIPNNNFESYLEHLGYGDGTWFNNTILNANACNETFVDITNQNSGFPYGNINNLTGIEAFIDLEKLYVNNHTMSTLPNFSFAPNLKYLWAASNSNLTGSGINVTSNPLLEILRLTNSGLNSLPNISNNPVLKYIQAVDTGITAVDFSDNPLLERAHLQTNNITSYNFTGCTVLWQLHVSNNNAAFSIDVSMCVSLTEFYASACPNVAHIYLGSNINLATLSFSTNSSNASAQIHVGTAGRITQANLLFSGAVGTFVI